MSGNLKVFVFLWLALVCAAVFVVPENISLVVDAQTTAVEARVTSVIGRATISGNGQNVTRLLPGATLSPGDEISTKVGGRVVIDLTDGSQVIVLPNSRVVVADYQSANSLRELLQITLGRILVRINHFQGKPNPYRVKSPTASIAVRGTVFEVTVEPAGETRVTVLNGAVEVSSLADPSRLLLAEPGRGVVVRPDQTIDFFASNVMTKETGERGKEKNSNNRHDDGGNSAQSAANVYERALESVVENGETPLPSRFAAFPDAHLDSLENPAYAGEFTASEGRLYFVPTLNPVTSADDELRNRFGLRNPRPLDYSFVPEATTFVLLPKLRAVIGGSATFVRNGLQSLTINEDFQFTGAPFPVGSTGLRTSTGTTTGSIFNGSFVFARRFGGRDQTTVGFGIERLTSRGSLTETTTLTDSDGLSQREQIESGSRADRTRFTFGVKHDFSSFKLGVFFRRNLSSGSEVDRSRFFNGVLQPNDRVQAGGNSSELGFRLRGGFSRGLFYGAEGTWLMGWSRENYNRAVIVDSNEHAATTRQTLGFGVGYILRPRTIFSFDAAGGLVRTNQHRNENSTGNLLEAEHQRARFISLHAAVQTDVCRNFFTSASFLSITQSRTTDTAFFPDRFGRRLDSDGQFAPHGRGHDFFTDYYSNYGMGYRFSPNFIVQYILTTDYGQTSPRHAVLLRYTFNFGGK